MKARPKIIIDNIDPHETYVIVRHEQLGAIAYHFERNVGGSGPSDLGAPYDVWRRTGEIALPDIRSSPLAEGRTVIASDIGAFDYAFYSVPNSAWGGSYHGGESLLSQTGTVLEQDGKVRSFRIERESLIEYGNGDTVEISVSQTIGRDGGFREVVTARSDDSFAQQYLGMEIGSGPAWTQYSVDGGRHWVHFDGPGTYHLGEQGRVVLRNAETGHTIEVDSDAADNAAFAEALIIATAERAKLYYAFDGGAMGEITVGRDVTFGIATGKIVVESGTSYPMTALDKNLILTGSAPIDGTGNDRSNVIGGNGSDNVLAGLGGADRISGAAGNDTLSGNGGADTFVFRSGAGADVITDFRDRVDTINLVGLGDYADLVVSQDGSDCLVSIGGIEIVLRGFESEDLSANDFSFR